MKQKPKAIMYR